MKKHITLLALPLISMLAMPAMAQHETRQNNRYDRIEMRIDGQHKRIDKGIQNGALTKNEARQLRKQQRRIAGLKHHFLQDGYLDRHERRTLIHKLDTADKRIYQLKHNDQYRYRAQRHPAYQHGSYSQSYKSRSVMLNLRDIL